MQSWAAGRIYRLGGGHSKLRIRETLAIAKMDQLGRGVVNATQSAHLILPHEFLHLMVVVNSLPTYPDAGNYCRLQALDG